jgi:hypothetical protein
MNNNWLIFYVTNSHDMYAHETNYCYIQFRTSTFVLFTYFIYIRVLQEKMCEIWMLLLGLLSNSLSVFSVVTSCFIGKTLRSLVCLVNCISSSNNKCFSQNKVCDISIGLSYKREHTFHKRIIISSNRFNHYRQAYSH